MRKIIALLLVMSFLSWAVPGYAEDLRLGSINLKNVLDKYKKVADGEDELLKEAEKKNKEREKLVKGVRALREKIELLNDKQKEKKQKELDKKVQQLQDATYEMRTGLRQNRDTKFREIMKEVKDVIEEYGQSRKYDIIIDDALLHYKKDAFDVTDDVVKILNQRYKK